MARTVEKADPRDVNRLTLEPGVRYFRNLARQAGFELS